MNWLLFVFCAVQVILPSDRTTVYDSLMFPVDRVFVFSDKISELQSEELEQMAVEFQGSVGVILVDVWVLEIKLVTFCHVSCWYISTLSKKKSLVRSPIPATLCTKNSHLSFGFCVMLSLSNSSSEIAKNSSV